MDGLRDGVRRGLPLIADERNVARRIGELVRANGRKRDDRAARPHPAAPLVRRSIFAPEGGRRLDRARELEKKARRGERCGKRNWSLPAIVRTRSGVRRGRRASPCRRSAVRPCRQWAGPRRPTARAEKFGGARSSLVQPRWFRTCSARCGPAESAATFQRRNDADFVCRAVPTASAPRITLSSTSLSPARISRRVEAR